MKKIANYADQRAIEQSLRSRVLDTAEANVFVWKPGENWTKAAKAVNPAFRAGHAKRVAAAIGVTIKPTPPLPRIEDRVAMLERHVDTLGTMVHALMELMIKDQPNASEAEDWARSFGPPGYNAGDDIGEVRDGPVPSDPNEALPEASGEGAAGDGSSWHGSGVPGDNS